jgi:SAM-dependent methyltransferase
VLSVRVVLVAALVLALAVACQSSENGKARATSVSATAGAVIAPGASAVAVKPLGVALDPAVIGDARDIAARDALRRPEQVIAALGLSPGQRVADIGAGFGYFTFRLARAVGAKGQVIATDIDPVMLDKLRSHPQLPPNVIVRQVAADDPGLEPGAYDLVFLSEVDHYLKDRVAYLKKLRLVLAPNGRLAITNRFALQPPLLAAAKAAGYSVTGEVTDLPFHYLVFLRPAPL